MHSSVKVQPDNNKNAKLTTKCTTIELENCVMCGANLFAKRGVKLHRRKNYFMVTHAALWYKTDNVQAGGRWLELNSCKSSKTKQARFAYRMVLNVFVRVQSCNSQRRNIVHWHQCRAVHNEMNEERKSRNIKFCNKLVIGETKRSNTRQAFLEFEHLQKIFMCIPSLAGCKLQYVTLLYFIFQLKLQPTSAQQNIVSCRDFMPWLLALCWLCTEHRRRQRLSLQAKQAWISTSCQTQRR